MNTEDYVSLEVAKLLKEKGFDRDTMCCYLSDGTFWDMENVPFNYNKCFRADLCPHNEDEDMDCSLCSKNCKYWRISTTSAPSLYEAQKWLRNEHNTYVEVDSSYNKNGKLFSFTINHYDDKDNWDWGWETDADDYRKEYEEALNAGIIEALKLI